MMRLVSSGILTGLLIAAVAVAHAAPAEVELALRAGAGMKADFVQRFTPGGFKTEQVERGTVVFGSAPKMRWTYITPEQKTFVFDGATSWLYSPAERQVTVTTLGEDQRREIPFVLISDSAEIRRHFTVREQRKGNTVVGELRPRNRAATVREVVVTIDSTTRQIRALSYLDRQGNRTSFAFSNYRKAAPGELAFHFTAPPGVDVVRSQR